MKFLFASPHCLLDVSSGAALSMHTLLQGLLRSGHQAIALGATVYDTESAASKGPKPPAKHPPFQLFDLTQNNVKHLLLSTRSWRRPLMVAAEEEALERHFRKLLDQAPPDVVITYGGMLLERSLLVEARSRGIKTVFNLVNASYQESHTFKDVDHIITDSQATADLYRDRLNLQLHVLGPLVDLAPYMVKHHQPRYVTLVNPSLEKGANLVARLALMCQTKLPDLEFLVVESRGRWDDSLQRLGLKGQAFPNVTVWPTQTDMRKVYEQTRILLVPSFGHESGGRVALEAMGNGIPVIAESQGGVKELLAGGGVLLDIPSEVRRHPTTLVDEASAQPWFDMLRSLCSDTFKYASAATRAREAAKKHDIQLPVQRFLSLFPAP